MKYLYSFFRKKYFEDIERQKSMFEASNPDQIIKKIIEDNFAQLSILEIKEFIQQCMKFYKEYETEYPKILEDRLRILEETEAFNKAEERWLSPE